MAKADLAQRLRYPLARDTHRVLYPDCDIPKETKKPATGSYSNSAIGSVLSRRHGTGLLLDLLEPVIQVPHSFGQVR